MRWSKVCRLAVLFMMVSAAFFEVSIMSTTTAQQPAARKEIRGRVIVEGGPAPRFTLPVVLPGRTMTVPINPQPDGTFTAVLPLGVSIVGTLSLPNGFSIQSVLYGEKDLLREVLTVAETDKVELIVTLNAPRLRSISGRVTGLKSNEGVRVQLRSISPGFAWEAPLRPDGSFVFSNTFPGQYIARVSYAGIPTSRSVALGDVDIKDLLLEVSRDRILLGHVLVESGTAPEIIVEARGAAGVVVSTPNPVATQGPGRTFKLRMPEGEYRLSIPTVPAGYTVRSFSYGPTDLSKEPLKLDGLGLWEIVVRLDQVAR